MIKRRFYIFCILSILSCLFFISCKKDSFITSSNARLSTSVDSLKYDTVFTSVGSITQSFKINNLNDQKLLLSKIKLMGADTSAFTININGHATSEVNNIEVAANDSIYIFVTVNINPTATNLPFIIQDSIQIQYNGNTRFVQLQAYGQNAHFLKGETLATNTNWLNDKPYVILDSFKIPEGLRLNISKGCKVYFHANAPMIVDGRLTVTGTKDEKVIFAGDRLDEEYKVLPASWPGIYFREASNNSNFIFAVIKNAYQAIVAVGSSATTKVNLHQTIIDNAYDAGILCVASTVKADNTLISNCGKNIALFLGGTYAFTNCTVASYGNNFISHKDPVLTVVNYDAQDNTADMTVNFTNCIFWGDNGSVKDEVVIGKKGTTPFTVAFTNCIYKAESTDADSFFTASKKNQDPLFDSVDVTKNYYDFHTASKSNAPGVDSGVSTPLFSVDLDNNARQNGIEDIGAYEKQ